MERAAIIVHKVSLNHKYLAMAIALPLIYDLRKGGSRDFEGKIMEPKRLLFFLFSNANNIAVSFRKVTRNIVRSYQFAFHPFLIIFGIT